MATPGSDERLSRVCAVINGKGGVGKCLAKFETVVDPSTGVPMTIEEAVQKRLGKVAAYTHLGYIASNRVGAWVDSGTKPVVRIELASGRSITVTPHHPMLMPDGWRRADQIEPGETVAAAGEMRGAWDDRPMDETQLDLLAILMAEGNTSAGGTRFTTGDAGIQNLATAGATTLGAAVVPEGPLTFRIVRGEAADIDESLCSCGCDETLPALVSSPSGGGREATLAPERRRFILHHGSSPRTRIIDFRIEHGLDFVLAKSKTMPKAIYRLPKSQLARFIAIFWMCDGYISNTGKPELTLASEKLVREFQHLLLRFGIQSRVSYKQATFDGRLFDAWRLAVYARSIPAFDEHIPVWGRKSERLMERANTIRRTGGNPNVGAPSLTPELWERIRAYAPKPGRKRAGEPRLRDVAHRLGWNFGPKLPLRKLLTNKTANGRRYISQKAMAAYIDVFGGKEELGHLVTDQLFWDRVVRVVDAGEEHVFDLSVPGPANFVANDLVVHNTSVASNVSGQLAAAGYQVLAVDLDLSGNLALDLGYAGDDQNDDGKATVDAVWNGGELNVLRGVRDNLDVVPGGRHLEMLSAISQTPMAAELPGGGVAPAFATKLAEIAGDYDLVMLDCAPGNPILQDMALNATRYVLIPTKTDAAGWDGLRMVGPRVKKARKDNPALAYIGVVLFGHATNATRILKTTRARLDEAADTVPVLESYIRHSETAAHDCRSRGQLAHELARDASALKKERFAALRARYRAQPAAHRRERTESTGENVIQLPPAQLSGNANSLAGDYEQLAREVLTRIAAIENAAAGGEEKSR